MHRTRAVARMAMCGATWGGLLGIPLGAALGLIAGLCWGHVSWGLDGAVFGLFGLGAAGAILGLLVAMRDRRRSVRATNDGCLMPSGR
jgi:hypothetical protein